MSDLLASLHVQHTHRLGTADKPARSGERSCQKSSETWTASWPRGCENCSMRTGLRLPGSKLQPTSWPAFCLRYQAPSWVWKTVPDTWLPCAASCAML